MLRATARAEAKHFWFRGLRLFAAPLIERALAGRSRPRILDCGCGTGANLEFLSRYGDPYGFDLTEAGLRFARQNGRSRIARADVAAAPFPTAGFDLITSFDVLYALDDVHERGAVAEMFRLARPGGHVLINVAAMDILRGDHSVLCHERRRYTRARLRRILSDAGFEIVRLTYTNQVLFPPLMVIRMLQQWRGLKHESEGIHELTVPPRALNALLTCALWAESVALQWFEATWFGTSVLCMARKPG